MQHISENRMLQIITRELRAFDGLERTPSQVRVKLLLIKDCGKYRRLTMTSFIGRLLGDPDLLGKFAEEMHMPDQGKIPSSMELGIL